MDAVMLIAMDDGLEINNLIQYIIAEELDFLLSDNLDIDLNDERAETSAEEHKIARWECSTPDNAVNQKSIRKLNVIKSLYDLEGGESDEERKLDYEEKRLNAIHRLLRALRIHNRIQQERNDILKSFIEICKIASTVAEESEIYDTTVE